MDDGRPIFLQIAEQIENSIIDGGLPEDAQVPSTNELAAFHRINPATAAKGVNQLVDDGILYKKRGIGMFVSPGAQAKLRQRRRDQFAEQYLRPLLTEAAKLGIRTSELKAMIERHEETR
ncbi:GntR family transcriptional regulator [Dactylosporangium salmoneum]|uniref:GntR family transcriptional regulator n=1 Tax=Dactylosporangium salmoneum TaxID=53361 RepID=A0ABP5V6I7_9ACTN